MNYNRLIIAGRLTRDPEMKYTPGGTAVCEFGIATSRKARDQEETLFIDVTLFGKTAETAGQYLAKGAVALIEGRLRLEQWQDKSGQKRSKMTMVGDSMQLGPRAQEGGGRQQRQFKDPDANSQWDDSVPF